MAKQLVKDPSFLATSNSQTQDQGDKLRGKYATEYEQNEASAVEYSVTGSTSTLGLFEDNVNDEYVSNDALAGDINHNINRFYHPTIVVSGNEENDPDHNWFIRTQNGSLTNRRAFSVKGEGDVTNSILGYHRVLVLGKVPWNARLNSCNFFFTDDKSEYGFYPGSWYTSGADYRPYNFDLHGFAQERHILPQMLDTLYTYLVNPDEAYNQENDDDLQRQLYTLYRKYLCLEITFFAIPNMFALEADSLISEQNKPISPVKLLAMFNNNIPFCESFSEDEYLRKTYHANDPENSVPAYYYGTYLSTASQLSDNVEVSRNLLGYHCFKGGISPCACIHVPLLSLIEAPGLSSIVKSSWNFPSVHSCTKALSRPILDSLKCDLTDTWFECFKNNNELREKVLSNDALLCVSFDLVAYNPINNSNLLVSQYENNPRGGEDQFISFIKTAKDTSFAWDYKYSNLNIDRGVWPKA